MAPPKKTRPQTRHEKALTALYDAHSPEQLAKWAAAAGTTPDNLRVILCYGGNCSPKLALALSEVSGGSLAKEKIRPDIFGKSKAA